MWPLYIFSLFLNHNVILTPEILQYSIHAVTLPVIISRPVWRLLGRAHQLAAQHPVEPAPPLLTHHQPHHLPRPGHLGDARASLHVHPATPARLSWRLTVIFNQYCDVTSCLDWPHCYGTSLHAGAGHVVIPAFVTSLPVWISHVVHPRLKWRLFMPGLATLLPVHIVTSLPVKTSHIVIRAYCDVISYPNWLCDIESGWDVTYSPDFSDVTSGTACPRGPVPNLSQNIVVTSLPVPLEFTTWSCPQSF